MEEETNPSGVFEGLTHYWNFDESSGTNIEDQRGIELGDQYNITKFGASSIIGKIGNAMYCDGNDYASSDGGITGFPSGTNEWTINFWMNEHTDVSYAGLIGMTDDNSQGFEWFSIENSLRIYIGGGSQYFTSTGGMVNNKWYMVTVIRDTPTSSGGKLYIDGVLNVTSTNIASAITGNLLLCYFNANGKYNGAIDELGIWNRRLSSKEITDLYNDGKGLTYHA